MGADFQIHSKKLWLKGFFMKIKGTKWTFLIICGCSCIPNFWEKMIFHPQILKKVDFEPSNLRFFSKVPLSSVFLECIWKSAPTVFLILIKTLINNKSDKPSVCCKIAYITRAWLTPKLIPNHVLLQWKALMPDYFVQGYQGSGTSSMVCHALLEMTINW